MKTLGIGVDIIDNSRIKKSISNKKFLNRIFSYSEIKFSKYGKPKIKINKKLNNIIKNKFKTHKVNVHLSISDEKKHSVAFVILDKK